MNHLEVRIPGTRQWWKLAIFVIVIAVFLAAVVDLITRGVVLLIFVPFITHDLFSTFGWEWVIVDASELRLERRLFGVTVKRLSVPRQEVEAVELLPKPRGIEALAEPEDRDQEVWSFSEGPIRIQTPNAYIRFGQSLYKDRATAEAIARQLREVLFGSPLPTVRED